MNVPKLRFKEFDGEWEEKKLKNLILTVEAGVSVNSTDTFVSDTVSKAVLKTSAISKGNFNHKENKKVIEEDLERVKKPVKADTILVSRMNTPALVGEVGYVEDDHPNLYLPDRLWEVEVNKNITTSKWLVSALVTDKNEYKIKSLGTGTSGSMKNIAKRDFLNIDIKVPVLKEQFKIQSFMGILNKKIQLQQQKIDLLQEQKKGFLQKMFPKIGEKQPEMRFVGFTGDWEQHNLGDILIERNIHKPQSEYYPLVSFTVEKGVTPKTDRYEREQLVVGDKASKKYKVTELNDIVYNPANLKFGAIARNKYGKAVFSPIYVTFEVNDKLVYPNYVEMFVTRRDFIQYSLRYQQGTVYERQSVSPENLLSQTFSLPCMKEQQKIGAFFKKLDDTIGLHQQKLDLYKEQKKGFMQQMFI